MNLYNLNKKPNDLLTMMVASIARPSGKLTIFADICFAIIRTQYTRVNHPDCLDKVAIGVTIKARCVEQTFDKIRRMIWYRGAAFSVCLSDEMTSGSIQFHP